MYLQEILLFQLRLTQSRIVNMKFRLFVIICRKCYFTLDHHLANHDVGTMKINL